MNIIYVLVPNTTTKILQNNKTRQGRLSYIKQFSYFAYVIIDNIVILQCLTDLIPRYYMHITQYRPPLYIRHTHITQSYTYVIYNCISGLQLRRTWYQGTCHGRMAVSGSVLNNEQTTFNHYSKKGSGNHSGLFHSVQDG